MMWQFSVNVFVVFSAVVLANGQNSTSLFNLRALSDDLITDEAATSAALEGMRLSRAYGIPSKLLVVFDPDVHVEVIHAAIEEHATRIYAARERTVDYFTGRHSSVTVLEKCKIAFLTFPPGTTVHDLWAAAHDLGRLDIVMSIESDGVLLLQPVQNFDRIAHTPSATNPNDPLLNLLWGLKDVKAPEAWDIATGGEPGAYRPVVTVIDTGVDYTHPDIVSNIWVNEAERDGIAGVDDDGNGYIDDIHGWNAFANNGDPFDDHWHGTHVSGTIGATTNNNEGVAGVNWSPQIQACKFLNDQAWGTISGAITCIDYALANNVWLSNNSWGSSGYSRTLRQAIRRANSAGHLFVAASGNNGHNTTSKPSYPGSYGVDNIVAVAAIDNKHNLADFSDYGAKGVDIAAPGVDIASLYPGGGYAYASGTSMAAPHVTGALSLMKSVKPNLTMGEALELLKMTANFNQPESVKWKGKLDMHKMVQGLLLALPNTTTTTTTTSTSTATTASTSKTTRVATTTTQTTTTTGTTPTTPSKRHHAVLGVATITCTQNCAMRGSTCCEASTVAINTDIDECFAKSQDITGNSTFSTGGAEEFGLSYPSGCFATYWKGVYQLDINTYTQGTEIYGCDAPASNRADSVKVCLCGHHGHHAVSD